MPPKQSKRSKHFKKKKEIPPDQLRRQQKAKENTRRSVGIFALILVAALYTYVFYISPTFVVKQVRIERTESLTDQVVHDIEADLTAYLIDQGQHNLFRIKKARIREIIDTHTLTDTLRIRRQLPDTAIIVFTENSPALVWREQTGDEYYVDSSGVVIRQKTDDRFQYSILTTENATSSTQALEQGSQVFTPEFVSYVTEFKKQFDATIKDFTLKKIIYAHDKPTEAQFETNEGWVLIVDHKNSIPVTLSDIAEVLEQIIRSDRLQLQYMDVRIEGRVYYK